MGRLYGQKSIAPVRTVVEAISRIDLGWNMNARNFREGQFRERNQRARGDCRIRAGRRSGVAADPCVHVRDHRAPEKANRQWRFRSLSQIPRLAAGGRKRACEMLQAREEVNAHIVARSRILPGIGGGVDQRGGASPIFIRSVGEKYLRNNMFGGSTIEQAAFVMGQRIEFGFIGKWKDIGWKKYGHGGLGVS